jgi:hypothetical protein
MGSREDDERTDEEIAESARESLAKLTPDGEQDADGTTRDIEQDPEAG